ncbi:MFS transporter (plasmid) [Rhodococcus opacus]|nr:MFS transporter [Rhodococcus opacus]WLF52685.1 MFS transporter [Rhodococcus opacus]
MYLIAYLDRNNVGFARVGMEHTLGLNDAAYGLGAGIFFVGYVIMEIPSNAGMYRFGARKWMARILISWGILAVAMAFVVGESSFYILRFLLGAAEAGFFPAVLFYFTLWVPAAHRAGVLGLFVLAQPVANALGSPLSGLLLNLDGTLGLRGWQWMFIVEGIPAVILGVLAPRLLTDRPADARWLARDEREWLTRTMDAENAVKESTSRHPFLAGLKDRRAIAYGLMNLGMVCGIYGLGLWLPSIVGALGTFSNTQLGLLVMLPYAAAIPCVYYWSKRADRTGRRAWHASISMITAAVGLVGAGFLLAVHPILALAFLTIAAIGIYSAVAPFLAMPSAVFAGAAAAAGLGLVNSLGNIGGFVSPYIVGLIKTSTGNTQIALVFLAGCLALTGLIVYRYAHSRPEGNVSAATAPHPSR